MADTASTALPAIKSQPVYPPLAWDADGRRHLLVAAQDDAELLTLLAALGPCPGPLRRCTPDALADALARETMGLRLYLVGDESLLWQATRVAYAAGLGDDVIRRHRLGTLARPVWCVHCQTMHTGVRTNLVRCDGCGRHLFVRDHFSRHVGAYMGVMVDAEVPGERPPTETLYP